VKHRGQQADFDFEREERKRERERRVSVYEEAPGSHLGPRDFEFDINKRLSFYDILT
jgi:hypothetical protein